MKNKPSPDEIINKKYAYGETNVFLRAKLDCLLQIVVVRIWYCMHFDDCYKVL